MTLIKIFIYLYLNFSLTQNDIIMKIATIKNVQNLFSDPISNTTASKWIRECRDALNKKDKSIILTIEEFCRYHDIPYGN